MRIEELPGYIEALNQARLHHSRKTDPAHSMERRLPDRKGSPARKGTAQGPDTQIREVSSILAGLEADWVPEYRSFYKDECMDRLGLDYLAAGIHYFPFRGEWEDSFDIRTPSMLVAFARHVEDALASGLFAFLAHPDVFCSGWKPWDDNAISCARDILAAAEETKTPLEINCYGFRKMKVRAPGGPRHQYPHPEFWRIASGYSIRVIVNSDAHRPLDVDANLDEGYALAREFNLDIMETLHQTGEEAIP